MKMSASCMNRVHLLIPLTMQEEEVKERLNLLRLESVVHRTFQFRNRLIVPDFFLPKLDLIIECWRSESRRGVALGWAERNAVRHQPEVQEAEGGPSGDQGASGWRSSRRSTWSRCARWSGR